MDDRLAGIPPLTTMSEAAADLRVSRMQVLRLIRAGAIRRAPVKGKMWVLLEEDVQREVEKRADAQPKDAPGELTGE